MIPELLELVDEKRLNFVTAVDVSYELPFTIEERGFELWQKRDVIQ